MESSKGSKKKTEFGNSLLDSGMVQMLQDNFCPANNIYSICLDKDGDVVTKKYGSEAERNYLKEKFPIQHQKALVKKLLDNHIEEIVEEDIGEDYLKMCGVSIRVGGETIAIWIVQGIIEENITPDSQVPEFMKTTTADRFFASLAFLSSLTKQYFAIKLEEIIAQEAFQQSKESEVRIKAELHRSEVMTQVVGMLESEQAFTEIVDTILEKVCDYLDIETASLLQIDKDNEEYLEMICRWGFSDSNQAKVMHRMSVEEVPWANGKPYLISADMVLPEKFQTYFQKYHRKAGIYLPIEVNGEVSMYLAFSENRYARVWSQTEIKFINDVKQIIQSILSKRISKNSLASSYASLEAILENIGCGVYVVDLVEEKSLYANQQFKDMFEIYLKRHEMDSLIRRYHTDSRFSRPHTETYIEEFGRWYDIQLTDISWVDGKQVTLCVVNDVTDKKVYQQKIERQANNDFLTGLYNRMRCEQDLRKHIREAKEKRKEGALLYLDLDDFKHINDGLGHPYGDILLKAISTSLRRIRGLEDSCYRMGGDEFIVIVTCEHYDRLDEILDEIQKIFNKPWFLQRADYYCTMSMGVVKFPVDGDSVTELIKKADIALYEAKKAGKNRIAYYNDNVESTSFRRLDMEKNMRDATSNSCEEFEVYYQPIIDITKKGEECCGAEALVRWNSGKMGLVGPNEFIPLAEYLGLINPIGDFVLRKACERCKYWNDMGHPGYHINVNLSVVQLLQNDIAERIRKVLEETKLNPERLTLEVTESLAINDMGRMKKVLGEIKKLGVMVALDDFGTGYSSLNHIRELPIDIIKIDRCFVVDIGKDDYSETFINMVGTLAETIGVTVCVEGVEERNQLDKLKEMSNVQFIQGYIYDRPLREEEFQKKYL